MASHQTWSTHDGLRRDWLAILSGGRDHLGVPAGETAACSSVDTVILRGLACSATGIVSRSLNLAGIAALLALQAANQELQTQLDQSGNGGLDAKVGARNEPDLFIFGPDPVRQ